MKTVYLYYSYTGNAEKVALAAAKKAGSPAYEIKTVKKLGKIAAYTSGCIGALRGASAKIEPVKANLSIFDKIIVAGPVWAGRPAPAVNAILAQLPAGKDVEVWLTSGSGRSKSKEAVEKALAGKGMKSVTVQHVGK